MIYVYVVYVPVTVRLVSKTTHDNSGYKMKQLGFNSSFEVFYNVSGNSTLTGSENCKRFAQDTQTIKAVKILAYSIVLITSLFGNVVIIATVARNRRMRTTINFLIANVAAV